MDTEKICTKCKISQPLSEFHKSKTGRGGLKPTCRTCCNAYSAKYSAEHIKERDEHNARYYLENKEQVLVAVHKYYDINREKILIQASEKQIEYLATERGREVHRAARSRRRALEFSAPGNHTAEERTALFERFGGICAYCRSEKATHLDHIVPLSKGGSNDIFNCAPACSSCNTSKGAKMIHVEWTPPYVHQITVEE